MKTAEEWAREIDYTLSAVETIRQVRAEALEEAAEEASEHRCATWSECCDCSGKIATAIRQLKEQP